MSEQTCAHCTTRPVRSATICSHCTRTLEVAVANIGAYVADLDTVRTGQVRFADPAPLRRGGGPIPLPLDERFTDQYGQTRGKKGHVHAHGTGTELAWVARNTIVGWTRIVLEYCPPLPHPIVCGDSLCRRCQPLAAEAHLRRPPADNLVACCHYLQRLLPRIVAAEWAAEMLDEMLDLERRLRRFLDRPADKVYLGPCTAGLSGLAGTWICGVDLYAEPDDTEARCRNCNATYPTQARRRWLLRQAEDEWHTATEIARALVTYTDDISAEERQLAARIRKWAERGRLVLRDKVDVKGQESPRYRLGDVLNLVYGRARDGEDKAG